jgi:hypothetical protein
MPGRTPSLFLNFADNPALFYEGSGKFSTHAIFHQTLSRLLGSGEEKGRDLIAP